MIRRWLLGPGRDSLAKVVAFAPPPAFCVCRCGNDSEALELSDLYFTADDYRHRVEAQTKQRFIDAIRERFNARVGYKGRVLKWDSVIHEKTTQLGRYLTEKSKTLDFAEPAPILERTDNRTIREDILCLRQSEGRKRGIGKSTLHYLQRNASGEHCFYVSKKVREKILV